MKQQMLPRNFGEAWSRTSSWRNSTHNCENLKVIWWHWGCFFEKFQYIQSTARSRSLIETHKSNLMQNQYKTIKGEAIYTCNVNRNKILFDFLTLKHVINRFILHHKCFLRLWKPKMTVQVKLPKLASIPPRWAKHAPNQPKWPQFSVWTWLRWNGAIITLWYAWVCKNRWVRSSRWH